ncbi:MAG: cation diffusion facilitator family transporter [Rhizobiales bacterium]|nr:cation diffusion facilitator family transporter [Hyphomicrobiales bacterium]
MPRDIQRISLASIAVAVAVLALKLVAWRITGSVALFSDALESVVNVAAAVVTFLAVRLADKPADRNHPYGHHKAEYLSAVFEGVLIVLAALAVLDAAWRAALAPREISEPFVGMLVNGLAGVLNALWGVFLLRRGRAHASPALMAEGRHLLADVGSSAAVLAGLAIAIATGYPILDAVLAAIVGIYILWCGWNLVRDSLGGLMDEAIAPDLVARIRTIIEANAGGAIEVHDLRTRRAGRATFVEFHLVVSGRMPVREAHAICDRIEAALRTEIVGVVTTIHVEPSEKAKGPAEAGGPLVLH